MTKSKTGILLAILLSTALLVTALIKATPPLARAAEAPTEEFKAKAGSIPTSTIQTVSAFDLNDAKLVGGGAKTPDAIAGATSVISPDGNFRLVQGTRMFVEYINRAAIKDTGGKYQQVPGSITLQWDDAAIDKTTGKMLDVQLTIGGINLRLFDASNKQKTFSRQFIDTHRLAVLINWQEMGEVSHIVDMHSPGATTPEQWYKKRGFSSLSTACATEIRNNNNYFCWDNYTIRFLNQDGSENKGTYNMVATDIDVAGHTGTPGKWRATYSRADRAQEHIKLLTPGDGLYVTRDTVLWTDSENPKQEAWSTRGLTWAQTEGWALAHIRSGSTIEFGVSGGINLFAQLDPLFSKITVTKKGNGLDAGQRFITGHSVNFTYEVENVGVSKVSGIKVTDSKGVKVTCPKTVLQPKEKMTCTGTGVLK